MEVTFGSRNIEISAKPFTTEYMGEHSLQYAPSFEATLYFTVSNGPLRHTVGVSNYQISIEKDGEPIDKSDLVPGTYDIHVTRAEDKYWNALDIVLKDDLIITKQTNLIQWSDLELTANPGDTLADIEKPAYLVSPLDGKQIPGTFYWIDDESTSVGELGDRTGFKFRFVPDPLSDDLAVLYDFSAMPEDGFQGDEWNPYTAYVTVKEASDIPSSTDPIDLPVRVLEEGDTDYSPAPELSAAFTPDTAVTAGEFNEFQGLAIDYYYPMIDAQPSEGYDIQAEYTVSIPLTDYASETLSGTLTIPLPEGYDGANARIKGGASASSYTATTVSFPVTLDISYGTAEASLLIEYKEAQEPAQPEAPVIIKGAGGTWQNGSKDGLSFTSDAEYADFLKVMVDGKELKTTDYTVKEGSTIVTLNAAYLETLSVGKHTLEIESKNGIAKTEFTITAAQTGGGTTPQEPDKNGGDTTNPQTGDSNNILLWVALLFLSGGALSVVTYKKKKQTN